MSGCGDSGERQAWHPCSRRVNGSGDAGEILAALDGEVTVAWLSGACEAGSTAVGPHRVVNGPLPSHRQPPGDLLNFDAVLVAAAATGAERLATDVLARTGSATELAAALHESAAAKLRSRPLCGLVLAGGESRRMGRDKADLEVVAGVPEAVRLATLLDGFCEEVRLSVRPGQELAVLQGWDKERWPVLTDGIVDAGPMAGIITAMRSRPEAAWLVVACDLPNLSSSAIEALLAGRKPLRYATAFRSANDGFPEPLGAVYEPKALARLLQFLAAGCKCPRRVLNNSRIELVDQEDPRWMLNMNHPEEFAAAREERG